MRRTVAAILASSGCYFGAGPSAGISLTHGDIVLGWEASAVGVAGLTGGQVFRHGERWRTTAWGALDFEWPVVTDRDHVAVPLLRGQLGGAEGDTAGFVAGFSAGALLRPGGICSEADYAFDLTLSIRTIAGDTQLALTGRAAYYPFTRGCANP